MINKLEKLNKNIINCNKCKRLVDFRKKIASEKTKRFKHHNYWGRPITGFGDPNAKVMFVGLAPAAHGGNENILGRNQDFGERAAGDGEREADSRGRAG